MPLGANGPWSYRVPGRGVARVGEAGLRLCMFIRVIEACL